MADDRVLHRRRDAGEPRAVMDGWRNLLTRSGYSEYDKTANRSFRLLHRLQEADLNEMYRGEGFAKKVIDVPVHEMMREGWWLEGDEDGEINDTLRSDELGLMKAVRRHLTWDRLHGGSLLVLGIDDGGGLEDEANEAGVRRLMFAHVYDRWQVQVQDADLEKDPNKERFNLPEYYEVTPTVGVSFKVHHSRCHVLDGVDIPDRERQKNQGWGDSALQAVFTRLASLGGVYKNVETITEDFVQTILQIDNLQDLIAAGEEDVIRRRLAIIDEARHVLNTILLDSREKYEKSVSSVSGLEKVIQEFAIALSAVTSIPVTLLMGRSPAGMDATGEADTRSWYDRVASMQSDKLKPVLDWLLGWVLAAEEYGLSPDGDEELTVQFNPLWQPSEKERAETYKTYAEGDMAYVGQGVLLPEEVAEARFTGDSVEDTGIEVNIEERKRILEENERKREAARAQAEANLNQPPQPEE